MLLASMASAREVPGTSVAPDAMRRWAPALANDTDRILYGDVWRDPALSPRDRSIVTVAVLVATGRTGPLAGHMGRALDNGVTPTELSGVLSQLAYYSGWPSAVAAFDVMDGVMRSRGVAPSGTRTGGEMSPVPSSDAERTRTVRETVAPVNPKLAALTDDLLFADVWRRPDLSPRDRSLVTIAALTAAGDAEQLPFHVRLGRENGLTRDQIAAAITHVAFYAGWPKAMTGTAALAGMDSATVAALRVDVVPPGRAVSAAGTDHFVGKVEVSSPFEGTGGSRLEGATVAFAPSARTNWHSHPGGQLLVVTEGQGLMGTEDGVVRTLRVGDVVWTPADVMHWHGAAPTASMTHVAVSEQVPGRDVVWRAPVSDVEYVRRPR